MPEGRPKDCSRHVLDGLASDYSSYSSEPCTQRNDWMSIRSLGFMSARSSATVSANSSRFEYVSQFVLDRYRKSKPYSAAAARVTIGLRKKWVSGWARKPNTVSSGQVSTRVWRRGRSATTEHHSSNRFSREARP